MNMLPCVPPHFLCGIGLLCCLEGLLAQEVDPKAFLEVERQYLRRHSVLDEAGGVQILLQDLKRRQSGDARAAALAEYEVLLVQKMAQGFVNPRPICEAFEDLAASAFARAHPTYLDTLLLQLMDYYHDMGRLGRVTALRRELDFIHDWWILGPFDNERGSGFGRSFAPEKELQLDATYEGKKRSVKWRALPVTPVRGWIRLAAMLRPRQQVLCYAATCVLADDAKTVVLRLGSSEALKVFLNGQRVAHRELQRRAAHDQDAVALPLQAGANLLLLKICTQEGGLEFSARLRGLRGEPVQGVRVAAARADLEAAAKQTARTAPKAHAIFLGARSVFSLGPADAYRLASVLSSYHPDDPSDPRIQNLLRQAVKAMPEEAAPLFALASTRTRPERSSAEKEENRRRHEYEDVLQRHPGHLACRLALVSMDLDNLGPTALSQTALERALEQHKGHNRVHLLRFKMLHQLGLAHLAQADLQLAAAADSQGNFLSLARRLLVQHRSKQGRLLEAETALRDILARQRQPEDLLALARVLLRQGKRNEAAKVFEQGFAAFPFHPGLRARYARCLEAEGNFLAAMEQLRLWLSICPEDDEALVALARLHGLNGQVDRQRELLRRAVTLNPNRKAERRHLEFLEAEEKPFYHGFELDSSAIIAQDKGAPAGSTQANDPYYYLTDHKVVHAYRNGTTSEYRHLMVRILNEDGSKRFASYAVGHYPGDQQARLLEVKVIKKNGEVMQPRLRGSFASLPPLKPGDLVDIRYRVDDTAPSFFGSYFGFQHSFSRGLPAHRSSLVVVLDQGRDYSLQCINGAPQPQRHKDSAGRQVWSFVMHDLERFEQEERQPDLVESQPLVRISTHASWNSFASWYWNMIKDQSEISPAMRRKVQELTKGLESTRARILAIYRFVTTEVRYEAWEFGVHGYKPYSAPVIFERRHGDCKDKSVLLNAMLSVLGVKAHPTLIRAAEPRSKDDLSLPMVNHFNHCISYVEATSTTRAMYLDGTATYHPLDTLPQADYGAQVLVLRGPEEGRIQQVPWPAAEDNKSQDTYEIRVAHNGDAEVVLDMRPTLNAAIWLREYLGNEPARQGENLEKYLKDDFGNIQMLSFRVSDLHALDEAVALRATFKAPRFVDSQGKGLLLPSAIGQPAASRLALAEKRSGPLLLGVPWSTEQVIRYSLPPGYQPLELPAATRLDQPFGRFHLTWTRKAGQLEVERFLAFTSNRILPEQYPAFREFVTQVDQATRSVVLIERGGGR